MRSKQNRNFFYVIHDKYWWQKWDCVINLVK